MMETLKFGTGYMFMSEAVLGIIHPEKIDMLFSDLTDLHKMDKALLEQSSHPTNLLVTFLEYSSIVMQDTKGKLKIY